MFKKYETICLKDDKKYIMIVKEQKTKSYILYDGLRYREFPMELVEDSFTTIYDSPMAAMLVENSFTSLCTLEGV